MNVTIKTETVGQNFATVGVVIHRKREVHRTVEYPLGFTQQALHEASMWAKLNGYEVKTVITEA